jgi:2-C-methyl-D-erythritol 2,4-cyclodiphosphate synthase
MRTGIGFDFHRLVDGRELVLGGVRIPFEKGLLGHSDADVLVHAVCDALLGAAGLGDIGCHFPDTDPQYKGVSSINLLQRTCRMLDDLGFWIVSVDAVVLAEDPKIAPYRQQMTACMLQAMQDQPESFNIKGTTTEGCGMIGRGEGIGALATVLIESVSKRGAAGP